MTKYRVSIKIPIPGNVKETVVRIDVEAPSIVEAQAIAIAEWARIAQPRNISAEEIEDDQKKPEDVVA